MQNFKAFIIKYIPTNGGFDDTPLTQFLTQNAVEVVEYQSRFCKIEGLPAWSVLLVYRRVEESPVTSGKHEERAQKARAKEQQIALPEAGMPLYNALKHWRAERAKRENTPPYVYFLNQQLAALVRAHPRTLQELKKVAGIGSTKIEKYGREVLDIIVQFPSTHTTETSLQSEEQPDAQDH
jgi:superfamily II DNA helicase RecQ